MSPFRPDRARRGEDHYLGRKMLLFLAGAVLAMVGMAAGQDWLVYLAMAVLAVGIILRLASRRRMRRAEEDHDGGGGDGAGGEAGSEPLTGDEDPSPRT
jgi:Flp pilus assembly protein TadB